MEFCKNIWLFEGDVRFGEDIRCGAFGPATSTRIALQILLNLPVLGRGVYNCNVSPRIKDLRSQLCFLSLPPSITVVSEKDNLFNNNNKKLQIRHNNSLMHNKLTFVFCEYFAFFTRKRFFVIWKLIVFGVSRVENIAYIIYISYKRAHNVLMMTNCRSKFMAHSLICLQNWLPIPYI